jgi:glycosyltransferase involved in cell wall biosynthesis
VNVSIIIPAYNAAQTISDTLESVLAQTCPNWEAIVVNDGSSDATAEIAKGFAKRDVRIRVISQPNGGESAARNAGIALANHDWLLFLDADDWVSPAYLKKMTQELSSDHMLDAVHCGYSRVASDGTQVAEKYWPPAGDMFATLARRATFPPHACVVRKSLVDDVGGFDTSLRTCPDWDLWQRIARTGARFGAVREVLAFYRMSPNGASLDAYQLLKDGLRVLRQGHSPDPRVPNPHPEHGEGMPPEQVQSQEFYLLCWCAGLLLGRSKDARPLLDAVGDDHYAELYPDAIAQCIFEAAPLPRCQPLHSWEMLWPEINHLAEDFLVALEQQSETPDLARRALIELKRMVLKHSPAWQHIIEEYEQTIAKQQASIEQLDQGRACMERELNKWQQLAEASGEEKTLLENKLDEWQQLAEDLEQAKMSLKNELDEWQHRAEKRELLIAELQGKLWVRLGLRLRTLKHPGILKLHEQ